MVATLSKNTAGTSWSLGHERSYDVWGSVRSGAATGGPKGRHVANLGHVADDESGLIYMRARYYEPETGRFVSQDVAKDWLNWYVYAGNQPNNNIDANGNVFSAAIVGLLKFLLGHALMGNISDLIMELDNLTRYMGQLDSLMENELLRGAYSGIDTAGDSMKVRRRVHEIHKELKRLKLQAGVLKWGQKAGGTLDKLLGFIAGYNLILSSLIDDIDLGPEGYGSLEGVYGS